VRSKELGRYLLEISRGQGMRGEFVFGGHGKDAGLIRAGLEKLAKKEIEFLIATSVAEEGLSVSQVNAVFHYSVPTTGITRLQRSGRTGRDHPGEVFYFVIDHALDNNVYWKSLKAVSTMKKEVVKIETGRALNEQATIPMKVAKIKPKISIINEIKKTKLKKAEIHPGQMSLFKK
jgi:ERCC4-related helicase